MTPTDGFIGLHCGKRYNNTFECDCAHLSIVFPYFAVSAFKHNSYMRQNRVAGSCYSNICMHEINCLWRLECVRFHGSFWFDLLGIGSATNIRIVWRLIVSCLKLSIIIFQTKWHLSIWISFRSEKSMILSWLFFSVSFPSPQATTSASTICNLYIDKIITNNLLFLLTTKNKIISFTSYRITTWSV